MSPTSSPSSSAGSPPDSSPADTTFSASDVASTSTSRPSFVPLSFSPLSRLPPSASSEQPYQSFRTQRQSPSLSPPTQHSILTSEATATATRRHEEFEYAAGANPIKAEESANLPGTSSSHQHSSPQIGKKKRTRTLTTPQQSAVLHALLAQSRFPTTAMREEVGRAIGLSARKVQVWFQNQRQKARKPRSQGRSASVEPSLPSGSAPPPQFGPFNPVPISHSFSAESVPVSAAGSSSATDLSRKSSVYDEDLASSGSPLMMRGLPMPIPTPGSGGGTSSSMESEFHMGVGTSPNYSPVSTTMYNEPRQFHHPDHRVGVGGSGMPLKIELSPVSLRSSLLDSRHGHKESATPPQQPFLHYSPSTGTRAVNLNRSPSSVYPFTIAAGAIREEDKATRPSDSFFPDAPIILPPLLLSNDLTTSSPYSRSSSESSNTLVRPDPHLRYSASFPSYSQDTGSLRSTPSSVARSSASGLPPPFTLQPRPQWDWDKPLGPVLPSIGLPPNTTNVGIVHSSTSGLRQPQQSSSFVHPRPRTTSDPALPPLETRQSALLTEPWPLPPSRPIDPSEAQRQAIIEREEQRRLQYDVTKTTATGEISSTETQPSASSPSNRPRSDEESQREHRSSAFTLQPRDYHVE